MIGIHKNNHTRVFSLRKNVVTSYESLLGIGPNSQAIDTEFYTTEFMNAQNTAINN